MPKSLICNGFDAFRLIYRLGPDFVGKLAPLVVLDHVLRHAFGAVLQALRANPVVLDHVSRHAFGDPEDVVEVAEVVINHVIKHVVVEVVVVRVLFTA